MDLGFTRSRKNHNGIQQRCALKKNKKSANVKPQRKNERLAYALKTLHLFVYMNTNIVKEKKHA